jgi:hypothetical protein
MHTTIFKFKFKQNLLSLNHRTLSCHCLLHKKTFIISKLIIIYIIHKIHKLIYFKRP